MSACKKLRSAVFADSFFVKPFMKSRKGKLQHSNRARHFNVNIISLSSLSYSSGQVSAIKSQEFEEVLSKNCKIQEKYVLKGGVAIAVSGKKSCDDFNYSY